MAFLTLAASLGAPRRIAISSQVLEKIGAGCRNRTRDLLITNQPLYQLS
jgi:hypothetical protein